jgi:hypothetical protein
MRILGIVVLGAALSGCASSSALSLDWIYRADPSQFPHALSDENAPGGIMPWVS